MGTGRRRLLIDSVVRSINLAWRACHRISPPELPSFTQSVSTRIRARDARRVPPPTVGSLPSTRPLFNEGPAGRGQDNCVMSEMEATPDEDEH